MIKSNSVIAKTRTKTNKISKILILSSFISLIFLQGYITYCPVLIDFVQDQSSFPSNEYCINYYENLYPSFVNISWMFGSAISCFFLQFFGVDYAISIVGITFFFSTLYLSISVDTLNCLILLLGNIFASIGNSSIHNIALFLCYYLILPKNFLIVIALLVICTRLGYILPFILLYHFGPEHSAKILKINVYLTIFIAIPVAIILVICKRDYSKSLFTNFAMLRSDIFFNGIKQILKSIKLLFIFFVFGGLEVAVYTLIFLEGMDHPIKNFNLFLTTLIIEGVAILILSIIYKDNLLQKLMWCSILLISTVIGIILFFVPCDNIYVLLPMYVFSLAPTDMFLAYGYLNILTYSRSEYLPTLLFFYSFYINLASTIFTFLTTWTGSKFIILIFQLIASIIIACIVIVSKGNLISKSYFINLNTSLEENFESNKK